LKLEVRKASLLFLVLFSTWQIIYLATSIIPDLDWLFAYFTVLMAAVCYFILDRQKASDLGLKRTWAWRRYVIIALIFAVVYNLYWAGLGALVFSTGPTQVIQHGIFSIPYNALLALIVGFVEETSFRGYILRNLRRVYSDTLAITYSSVLFGLYHISLVYAFWSTMSVFQAFAYWALTVLAAFVSGLFLGYFYLNAEQTTIGNIAYHSLTNFLASLVPYSLATSLPNSRLFSTSAYIIILPLLILAKRKGWLSTPKKSSASL